MAAVILNVSAARRGEPCISLTGLLVDITPADAWHLGESLRMAADWATEIDDGVPGDGAPEDRPPLGRDIGCWPPVLDDAGIG